MHWAAFDRHDYAAPRPANWATWQDPTALSALPAPAPRTRKRPPPGWKPPVRLGLDSGVVRHPRPRQSPCSELTGPDWVPPWRWWKATSFRLGFPPMLETKRQHPGQPAAGRQPDSETGLTTAGHAHWLSSDAPTAYQASHHSCPLTAHGAGRQPFHWPTAPRWSVRASSQRLSLTRRMWHWARATPG